MCTYAASPPKLLRPPPTILGICRKYKDIIESIAHIMGHLLEEIDQLELDPGMNGRVRTPS